jgi:hypothetical protein
MAIQFLERYFSQPQQDKRSSIISLTSSSVFLVVGKSNQEQKAPPHAEGYGDPADVRSGVAISATLKAWHRKECEVESEVVLQSFEGGITRVHFFI